MSRHLKHTVPDEEQPAPDDLRDWAAIGMIVVASSLLLWTPFLV